MLTRICSLLTGLQVPTSDKDDPSECLTAQNEINRIDEPSEYVDCCKNETEEQVTHF